MSKLFSKMFGSTLNYLFLTFPKANIFLILHYFVQNQETQKALMPQIYLFNIIPFINENYYIVMETFSHVCKTTCVYQAPHWTSFVFYFVYNLMNLSINYEKTSNLIIFCNK